MPDGWISVIVTYALVGAVLAVWFWMILAKLARQGHKREREQEQEQRDG